MTRLARQYDAEEVQQLIAALDAFNESVLAAIRSAAAVLDDGAPSPA